VRIATASPLDSGMWFASAAPILTMRTAAPETSMNLIARARRYFAISRRSVRRLDDDPADMGTAFGLDAITTIQPESPAEIAARERSTPPSRIALRLHRRSTF
jgi:hypothetical protein